MYILNKKEVKEEVELYKKNLKWNKIAELIMIIFSMIIIALNIWLVIEFADKLEPTKFNIICGITGGILGLFIPLIFIWYGTGHMHLQEHMPIITNHNSLDICGILFDIINFALIVVISALTISSTNGYNNEASDHEVALFSLLSGSIFFIWGIIVPIIQIMIKKAETKTIEKYGEFQSKNVEQYIQKLKKAFPQRKKEFNERMFKKGRTLKTKNVFERPLAEKEKFSYDTRRVFRGKGKEKHNEYYMLKFCAFIDLFTKVYANTKTKVEIFELITNILTKKQEKHSKNFNKRISKI